MGKIDLVSDQYVSSTVAALIAIEDFISSLERPDVIGVQLIAYDLSKAFDRLKHDVILSRLTACNVPSAIVSRFRSYFYDRMQFVKVGNHRSSLVRVNSGVPHGSIVGPSFFLWLLVLFLLNLKMQL